MSTEVCPRCGFDETAVVKKELISPGKYKKFWRCPRCSHNWETSD